MPTLKRPLVVLGLVGLILLVPLLAMLFTSQVDWGPADFLIAGILLTASGILVDGVWRTSTIRQLKYLAMVGIFLVLALVWIELAVGLFGSPWAGK